MQQRSTQYGEDGKIRQVIHYDDKGKSTKMEWYKDGKLERTDDLSAE